MNAQPSATCPRCFWVSYHPKDIEEGYCAACHEFYPVRYSGPGVWDDRVPGSGRGRRGSVFTFKAARAAVDDLVLTVILAIERRVG